MGYVYMRALACTLAIILAVRGACGVNVGGAPSPRPSSAFRRMNSIPSLSPTRSPSPTPSISPTPSPQFVTCSSKLGPYHYFVRTGKDELSIKCKTPLQLMIEGTKNATFELSTTSAGASLAIPCSESPTHLFSDIPACDHVPCILGSSGNCSRLIRELVEGPQVTLPQSESTIQFSKGEDGTEVEKSPLTATMEVKETAKGTLDFAGKLNNTLTLDDLEVFEMASYVDDARSAVLKLFERCFFTRRCGPILGPRAPAAFDLDEWEQLAVNFLGMTAPIFVSRTQRAQFLIGPTERVDEVGVFVNDHLHAQHIVFKLDGATASQYSRDFRFVAAVRHREKGTPSNVLDTMPVLFKVHVPEDNSPDVILPEDDNLTVILIASLFSAIFVAAIITIAYLIYLNRKKNSQQVVTAPRKS